MAITVQIDQIESQGLRAPDFVLDLSTDADGVHPIVLIQMPNGTGKTTTLRLLRATLAGAPMGTAKEIRAYRGSEETGHFRVRLRYRVDDREEKRCTLTLQFDFESGTAQYFTTLPQGQKPGFAPPPELAAFLEPNMTSLFVFDGELARDLTDATKTRASEAVRHLFQLDLLGTMGERVDARWRERVHRFGAESDKALTRRRNLVYELETRLDEVRQKKNSLQYEHQQISENLEREERRHAETVQQNEELGQKVGAAEARLQRTQERVRSLAQSTLNALRNPLALSESFAQGAHRLRMSLDQVKLPETASREFFAELAEADSCVCGEPMTDERSKRLRERAQQYMGQDSIALLNQLKASVKEVVSSNDAVNEPAEKLSDWVSQLEDAAEEEVKAQTALDALNSRAGQMNPDVKKSQERADALRRNLEEIERQLGEFEEEYPSGSKGAIATHSQHERQLERTLEDASRELADITQTLHLKKQSDVLVRLLGSAQQLAVDKLSESIRLQANERIGQLMPNNGLELQSVASSLRLVGKEGGSEGETLAVGYGFLSTLLNRASHKLPFVVDSPAGSLDIAVRREVGALVPRLGVQFIAFTISTEREGFLNAIRQACEGMPPLLITLYRKGALPEDAAPPSGAYTISSNNAVWTTDPDFFERFQFDQEDE